MRKTLFLAAAVLAAAVAPAAAQNQGGTSAEPDDVVVIGRSEDKRSLDRQIQDVVRSFTPGSATAPLARFDRDRLCPYVVGLDARFNGLIAARMRRVASAARIALAPETCRQANALLIFTDSKTGMVAALRRRHPDLFRNERGEPTLVPPEDGPALAWHVRGLVTRDGTPIWPGAAAPTSGMASRLVSLARPVFLISIVVVERAGIDGLTATQIADYAAMRALTDATPKRARATGVESILTTLDTSMGKETPLTLTAWDLSYLRGLYAAPINAFRSQQRGAIGTSMKKELRGRQDKDQ